MTPNPPIKLQQRMRILICLCHPRFQCRHPCLIINILLSIMALIMDLIINQDIHRPLNKLLNRLNVLGIAHHHFHPNLIHVSINSLIILHGSSNDIPSSLNNLLHAWKYSKRKTLYLKHSIQLTIHFGNGSSLTSRKKGLLAQLLAMLGCSPRSARCQPSWEISDGIRLMLKSHQCKWEHAEARRSR